MDADSAQPEIQVLASPEYVQQRQDALLQYCTYLHAYVVMYIYRTLSKDTDTEKISASQMKVPV